MSVCPIVVKAAFYKNYIGCISTMEREEILKQKGKKKKKAGTKLKAYRLYIKKKMYSGDLFLSKMSYVSHVNGI